MIMSVFNESQIPFEFGNKNAISFDLYLAGPNFEVLNYIKNIAAGAESKFIYLWGQSGCGKSHLLQAACYHAHAQERHTAYIPLLEHEQFEPQILEGLETCDLVCIDDVHAIAGNDDWERALMRLFNALREKGHVMLSSGNDKPENLDIELADLRSRLSWDLVYHLKQLNDDGKIAALKQRAQRRAFELPDDVAEYLLKRVSRDPHYLFELLDKLDVASLSAQRKLTIPFVRTLVGTE